MMQFAHSVQLCHAKIAARTLVRFLGADRQRTLENSLRPLDDLDRRRLDGWKTVESLRPRDAHTQHDVAQPRVKRRRVQSLADLIAEESDDDEDERVEVPARMLLSITDTPHECNSDLILSDPIHCWMHRSKGEASIVLAEAGDRPTRITYIHCHREPRRVALLYAQAMQEYNAPGMVQFVRVAVDLVRDGCLPDHGGRKFDFLKRCGHAL